LQDEQGDSSTNRNAWTTQYAPSDDSHCTNLDAWSTTHCAPIDDNHCTNRLHDAATGVYEPIQVPNLMANREPNCGQEPICGHEPCMLLPLTALAHCLG
jgi:hypothetical protein